MRERKDICCSSHIPSEFVVVSENYITCPGLFVLMLAELDTKKGFGDALLSCRAAGFAFSLLGAGIDLDASPSTEGGLKEPCLPHAAPGARKAEQW